MTFSNNATDTVPLVWMGFCLAEQADKVWHSSVEMGAHTTEMVHLDVWQQSWLTCIYALQAQINSIK